jgi:hypothetical protein
MELELEQFAYWLEQVVRSIGVLKSRMRPVPDAPEDGMHP